MCSQMSFCTFNKTVSYCDILHKLTEKYATGCLVVNDQ